MRKIINYGSQFIDSADINSVKSSLKNELITSGKLVDIFEKKLSKYIGARHSIVCNSGTSALLLAFLALNIKKNDNVIIPSINFVASFNLLQSLGVNIYLCDVNPETGQMTPEKLIQCIKKNRLKKIKAIVKMYNGGYCDSYIEEFHLLKIKYNFKIIEDACHAFGASYKFKNKLYKIGSCRHSDISTFSLHPLKTITSGEGGILTTNNKLLHDKIKLYRSHGILRTKKHWNYDVIKNGYNFRLSDINCALGISQLKKINLFLKKRKLIYKYYIKRFKNFKNIISFPSFPNFNNHSYHLVIVNINFLKLKISKDDFFQKMLKMKIMCQFHYIPIYKFSVFKKKNNFKKKDFENSEKYYKTAVSLPIHYRLKNKDLVYIANILVKVLRQFKK